MKKFKNIKLMLLTAFVAMGSVNAFAGVGDLKTDGTYWYKVVDEAAATVTFEGVSNVIDTPDAIEIKATASLQADNLENKDYTVSGVNNNWWTAQTGYTQTITAPKSLTFSLRLDEDVDAVKWATVVTPALTQFAASLETLAIKDAHKLATIPTLQANVAKLTNIDLSGVSNDGNSIKFADDCMKDFVITKITLPNAKLTTGGSSFRRIKGPNDANGKPTAVNIDLSKFIEFGANAFCDANIATVTISADVTTIGANAFKATAAASAYVKNVVWSSNKFLGTTPALPIVPAVFAGQENIESITINADKVNSIVSGAFTDAKGTSKPITLDMTGATSLTSIAGAFDDANTYFKVLKLKDAPLKAANGKLSDIINLTKSQSTLTTLTLPASITTLEAFTSFSKLSTIDMSVTGITAIPANAFKDCTALTTITLPEATKTIGNNAFDGTNLTGIVIPGNVTSIGDYAFANIHPSTTSTDGTKEWHSAFTLNLTGAAKLASIGKYSFYNTNVTGTVDFTTTLVLAIPDYAFAKPANTSGLPNFYLTGATNPEVNFLEKVILNTGDLTSDPKKSASIGEKAFWGNVWFGKNNAKGLAEVEGLNQAALTGLGKNAFEYTALTSANLAAATSLADNKIQESAFANIPVLASVTLPTNVAVIDKNAFAGDIALATVTNLNQANLTSINEYAFYQSKIAKLDLSNASKLTKIETYAFGQYYNTTDKKWEPALTEIIFPAETVSADNEGKFELYTNQIQTIAPQAFYGASKLTKVDNLKDTKIQSMNQWFTVNIPADIDKNAEDSGFDDQTALCPKGLTSLVLPSAIWKSSDKAAISLTSINNYALQGLGIEEIVIPSTVSTFGGCVLQGCTSLKKFEWNDAKAIKLHKYTFRGDSNLEEVYFMTASVIASKGITDETFFWCTKDKLTVYVTAESLLQLRADGYTTANALYSKLNDELEKNIKFTAAGKSGDNYYRTYYNRTYSTWFDAEKFEVYSAVIKGQKIELVPADVENGYYKLAIYTGSNEEEAVAIIKAKAADLDENLEIPVLYQALPANNISTMPALNDMQVATADMTVSSLKYQFKFGKNKNTGAFGFFRVTSGTIKKDGIYIQATSPLRGDFFGIEDDATAIESVKAVEDGAEIYNLQGVRVDGALQKGIYVKNGKKFIVK